MKTSSFQPIPNVRLLTAEEKAEVVTNSDHLSRLRFSPGLPRFFAELRPVFPVTTCHVWRTLNSQPSTLNYCNVPGFCESATLDEIRKHNHVLTPGRYVGAAEEEEDGERFEKKMKRLTAELQSEVQEAAKLECAIMANLKGLSYGK